MTNLEFVAIEYWVGVRAVKMGPALGHFRNSNRETFYHWFGPSYMGLGKYDILKNYGTFIHDDDAGLDGVAIQFARDFPQRSALEPDSGWLSPQGKYYPCGSYKHIATARMLALEVGVPHGRGGRVLEERGWISVFDGLACIVDNEPTQKQLDVLFDLSQHSDASSAFTDGIMEFLEDYASGTH